MIDVINIPKYITLAKGVGLPVIVDGRRGPTGKSTLCRALCEAGIEAIEPWEVECGKKKQDKDCYLLVLLNDPLPDEVVINSYRSSNSE